MTTIGRATPIAMRLGEVGAHVFRAARRIAADAAIQPVRRRRGVHELSDWILDDIGIERVDRMSPEARRTLNRLTQHALW